MQTKTPATGRAITTVLLDVDGTLVDSNDAHAHAWVEAFEEHGVPVAFADVRRCIGMGGDKLMPEVSGIADDSPEGTRIARSRGEIFMRVFLPTLKPLRQSAEFVAALKSRGLTAVAASSAQRKELTQLLKIAGAAALVDDSTSSDDAEDSKPDPDIIEAALKKAGAAPGDAVMVGDTPYDIEAARRAGVPTIAFRSGGWPDADLAGAIAIFDGPWDLLAHIEEVLG
ncbi:MAG TPA: HAD family hydrolase [Vicinamibacterales bacterium]|nr:HAD family hydrolase [Vicinamibacterales bacterium]